MGNGPDYDDPDVEDAWCEERQREVTDYLAAQAVAHGRVGEWPAWHVAPVVSIWAIESAMTPGAMGQWVICGDLPTDYIAADGVSDPREAVRAFAERWRTAAQAMRDGKPGPVKIGNSDEERRSLAPLLESRARLLGQWTERDDLWEDLFDED